MPFDQLHAWRNPDRGFLVTANNRIGDAGPYVSLDFAGPARHDRVVELLGGLDRATVADMPAIHADVRSLRAPAVLDVLRRARPGTRGRRAALALLDGWDCQLAVESAPALVFGTVKRLWADEVGRRLDIAGARLGGPSWPPALIASRMLFDSAGVLLRTGAASLIPGLATDEARAEAMGAVFDAAAAELAERFGPDPAGWAWGAAHTMLSPHPLASARPDAAHLHPPVDPCGGDGDTRPGRHRDAPRRRPVGLGLGGPLRLRPGRLGRLGLGGAPRGERGAGERPRPRPAGGVVGLRAAADGVLTLSGGGSCRLDRHHRRRPGLTGAPSARQPA